MLLTENLEIPG